MKNTKDLNNKDETNVREKINELTNSQNESVDKVGNKQLFVTFNLYGVRQTSFTVEKRIRDSVLCGKNTSICLPVPDNINNEEEFEQRVKEMCPYIPDRTNVQDSLDDNKDRICVIKYNYRELDNIMSVIEKFDKEYDTIR